MNLIASVKRFEVDEAHILRGTNQITCPVGYGFPELVTKVYLGKYYPGFCVKKDAAYTEAIENIRKSACPATVTCAMQLEVCTSVSDVTCPN